MSGKMTSKQEQVSATVEQVRDRFDSLTDSERDALVDDEGIEVDGVRVWHRTEDDKLVGFRMDGEREVWAEIPR